MEEKRTMWRSKQRREKLTEILPLSTPLTINVEISSSCNLRCCYCLQSLDKCQKEKQKFLPRNMEYNIFKKLVDGCKQFDRKIKVLKLCGLGEPLINPRLEDMIKYANESGYFEKIILFSNGVLLTPERTDKIMQSGGIDSVLLDIQGISADDYLRYAGITIDYEKFIENIQYFFAQSRERNTEVFAKAYRFALNNQTERFFELFAPIADYVSIDNIYEVFKNVDYSGLITTQDTFGNEIDYKNTEYCPQPLFLLAVNADGTIEACCNTQDRNESDLVIGDIRNETLYHIWNGKRLKFIRNSILRNGKVFPKCKDCKLIENFADSDIIDTNIEKLRQVYL